MKYFSILLYATLFISPVYSQKLEIKKLEGMKARSIGPAAMSGRITALAVQATNPDIIYAGSASGGLWKSQSGGISWDPIFDKEPTQSIGSISIFQKNPDIVWVGTGEGNPRNSVSSGSGVFRTLDAGKTWNYMGLNQTRNIHRIIADPENPDIIYVGATGYPWGDTPDRGVYKSTDGGKTWNKILFINETTGVGDLVMDPVNPNKIFAGMWDHRRWPWFFRSGGPGSGLYMTIDGGNNWKKLGKEEGLPDGELGRIGLAISRSQPNIVYAIIESKQNGLYRSEDGGYKWHKVADKSVASRPFYFAEIYVDPQNENRVYNLTTFVTVSEDGGKSFTNLLPGNEKADIHVDHHAWYVNPYDHNFLIDGNDGGMAISRDRGRNWQYMENLPLGQYYHINVDNDTPYNIYGGMQDNGSWKGPAYVWRIGGIRNAYWQEVGWGDGFDVIPDPDNSQFGYFMSQQGYVERFDAVTGNNKFIRPVHPDGIALRFNWNAAIAIDPFDNKTIYFGSQFIHKSQDKGNSWSIISPDLTTNNPEKQKQNKSGGLTYDVTGAENHTTILCISPSPLKEDVIWAGTDDGNVQLTTDGGKSWTSLSSHIKGMPEGSWVPQIKPSTYHVEEAYVVVNNYRRNDWNPYIFHTRDFGKTWESILNDNQVSGYALSFIQDPFEPRLMFAGTEFGLFVSIDEGKSWSKWENGYPSVSTMDLAIQSRESDLIMGTFGRSAYVLDDLRPLRELASKGTAILDLGLHIYPAPDAWLAKYQQPPGPHDSGDAIFLGENRPGGAEISFSVKDTSGSGKVKIEVINSSGKIIRSFHIANLKPGLNRIHWGLDRKGARYPGASKPRKNDEEPAGPQVIPGTYKVRLSYKSYSDSTNVIVHMDPRIQINTENLVVREKILNEIMGYAETAADLFDQISDAQQSIEMILNQTAEDTSLAEIKKASNTMKDSLKVFTELYKGKEVDQGIVIHEDLLMHYLFQAQNYINSSEDAPGENPKVCIILFKNIFGKAVQRINHFFENEWVQYQLIVENQNIKPFKKFRKIELSN
jgi:photosystem II stability/assembly factor-like uncharacterized protein